MIDALFRWLDFAAIASDTHQTYRMWKVQNVLKKDKALSSD